MSSVNLAICIAPNLIKERSGGGGFINTGNTTMIMKTLIDECDFIFEEDIQDAVSEQHDDSDGAGMSDDQDPEQVQEQDHDHEGQEEDYHNNLNANENRTPSERDAISQRSP